MKRVIPPLLLFVALSASLTAQPAPEYIGLLDREPVVETRQGFPVKLDAAPQELVEKLPAPPAPGDRLFSGALRLFRTSPLEAQVVLVEPAQGKPFFYADFDFDGRFAARERAELEAEPDGKWEAALLRFPSSTVGAAHFPISLGRFTSREQAADESVRRFIRSRVAYQQGWVQVEDRTVLVRYPLSPDGAKLQITRGSLGMDLDGNGKIDRGLSQGEIEVADENGVVFRLGELYLSTKSLDPATGRIVLRTHPASDYRRFDLRPGAQIPDFTFTDLEGQERRLSELRGKVVFLDFWGVWCGACVEEMGELRKLYEAHRGRGFEILGMDFEDDLKTQKSFVAAMDLPWVHATAKSVEDVVTRNFRVWAFPTHILLDREGRVVSAGDPDQPPLHEEGLAETIAEAVSRPAQEAAVPASRK